jgi:predicted nuclease with RNAse H fold
MYSNNKIPFYMGIDVQISKGSSYFIVDEKSEIVNSGWAKEDTFLKTAHQLRSVAFEIAGGGLNNIAIGIDSPRMPLKYKRKLYWNRKNLNWGEKRQNEEVFGRHCEVVLKSLGIANPQWTRTESECLDWMKLGFMIYEAMKDFNYVFEVFPSASYNLLRKDRDLKVKINFANFSQGPKDMIDACIAAMTVYEFMHGRGAEVGGGDGLGTIILPRPLPDSAPRELLLWPDE